MFAFAVRLRRKNLPEEPVVVVDSNKSGKLAVFGVLSIFFGSIFLFFELYGKCSCKLDWVGYSMIGVGMIMVSVQCINGLIVDYRESNKEDGGNNDDQRSTSDIDEMERKIGLDSKSLGLNEKEMMFNIYRPVLLSRQLSPVNSELKLIGKQTIRVIKCNEKINSKLVMEANNYYNNLPAVVIDA